MNLNVIRNGYISEGYDVLDASSKTCQDVIISKIAKSPLTKNVYYLIAIAGLDKEKLIKCITELIFSLEDMREANFRDVYARLTNIFQSKAYLEKAGAAHNNWLEIPIEDVTEKIISFISEELAATNDIT